jgi:hypothetical protein
MNKVLCVRVTLSLLLSCACGDVANTLDPTLLPVEVAPPVEVPAMPAEPPKPNPFNPLATACLDVQRTVVMPDATVGCAPSKVDVTITNRCDFEVWLSSTRSGAFGFSRLPSSLAPGASGQGTLGFLPTTPGRTKARVTLNARADGHQQDSSLLLEGSGTAARRASWEFVVPLPQKVELLVVVDDDGVVEAEANFGAFARSLASAQNSRVVVSNLSGDVQRPDGVSVLVPESPTFIDRFRRATRVSRTPGVRSCHETALRLKVLREPAGFWNELSPRAVVCITNEVDQSDVSGSSMLARWEGRPGVPTMTSFSLVAPFLPTQCGVLDPRLAQLPEVTGGVREELCSPNWSSVLDTWSRSHFGYRLWFQLPASPTMRSAQTLEVSVNGVALPAQSDRGARLWRYDDATGAIIFELLSVPEPGQALRATWETCDAR